MRLSSALLSSSEHLQRKVGQALLQLAWSLAPQETQWGASRRVQDAVRWR